jgi:hypothetical protein
MRPTSRIGDQQRLCQCDYGTRSDTGVGRQCDQYMASINGSVLQFKGNLGANFSFTNQGTSLAAQANFDASPRMFQTQFQNCSHGIGAASIRCS